MREGSNMFRSQSLEPGYNIMIKKEETVGSIQTISYYRARSSINGKPLTPDPIRTEDSFRPAT